MADISKITVPINGTNTTYNIKDATARSSIPAAATATPKMDGTAAVGSSEKYAKEDHVHPSDTSRVAKSGDTMTGTLTIKRSSEPTLVLRNTSYGGEAASARVTLTMTNAGSQGLWSSGYFDGTNYTTSGKWLIERQPNGEIIVNGNAATATKLANTRYIDGVSFDGSKDIVHYGICETAADTAAKTVTITGFDLKIGAIIYVKFTNNNTTVAPTLNVNDTGAKPIYMHGMSSVATNDYTYGWFADDVVPFVYDGTSWVRPHAYNSHRIVRLNGNEILGNSGTPLSFLEGSNVTLGFLDGIISISSTDTNTHRPIQINDTEILGNSVTPLNLKDGANTSLSYSNGTVTINSTDTNTHRPIQVNDSEILGNSTTPLNLKEGSHISMSNSAGDVTIGLESDYITTQSFTATSATTVNGNSNANATITITKSGYTPLGIMSINKTGTQNTTSVPIAWYLGGTTSAPTATVTWRNLASSTATLTTTVVILYRKN